MQLPHQPFSNSDVERKLLTHQREIMLDLVLAWASLDGALGMLLASVKQFHPVDGADYVKGMGSSERFRGVVDVLRITPGAEPAAKNMRRYKRIYERYSKTRNKIAHSHCAGYVSGDPERIVFLPYERVNSTHDLAVDIVPLEQMRKAVRWGTEMRDLSLRIFDDLNESTPVN